MNFKKVLDVVHKVVCRILNPLQIRAVIVRALNPFVEGVIVYPIDYGYHPDLHVSWVNWLCFQIKIMWKLPPFPTPDVTTPVTTEEPRNS